MPDLKYFLVGWTEESVGGVRVGVRSGIRGRESGKERQPYSLLVEDNLGMPYALLEVENEGTAYLLLEVDNQEWYTPC